MRRKIAAIFSLFSLFIGMLIALPPLLLFQWSVQLAATEISWVSALAGTVAVVVQPRHWRTVLVSMLGVWLSTGPYRQFRKAIRHNNLEMNAALGAGYIDSVPQSIRHQLQTKPLSLRRLFYLNLKSIQAEVIRDVPYLDVETRTLVMDIYKPKKPALRKKGYPCIVTIHGGSWRSGDKGQYFADSYRRMADQGYLVFDIQYRFSQEARWPAQHEDVTNALKWIAEHAAEYGGDKDNLALIGRSAGGFLALHGAYRALPEVKVKAVIAAYAPVDLRLWPMNPGSVGVLLMGGVPHEMPERYYDSAVTSHLHEDCPPTLLLHGGKDSVVPIMHSQVLQQSLTVSGVTCALVDIPWGQHGFDGNTNGLGAQLAQYYLDRFLAWSMYGGDKPMD
ncbi:MAG: alpha/beta hydrolase [Anaerolineae bacterium]|nr:alpha/beta hydrolase [Anaerolineae bacterium]